MEFKTSDGVNIYYEDEGSGVPLIFLNGLWGDTSSWKNQVSVLKDEYRCISVDHRGIGKSDKWVGEYSYKLYARDIYELLQELKIKKCHILGVCHGGMVATAFAKEYSEKLISIVINGTQIKKSHRQKTIYEGWKNILNTAGFEVLYRAMIIPSIMSERYILENIDRIDGIVEATNKRIKKESAVKMIEAARDYGYENDEIENINVPALIMAGEEDLFSPPYLIEEIQSRWKGSDYYLFKDTGHFPQRESTEEYNNVVRKHLAKYKIN